MSKERVHFKTTLEWINSEGYEMEVVTMTRERLEFKTTLARIDAGINSGYMYELLTQGFKGYENFSDSELETEFLKLTGKVVKVEREL